MANYRKLKTKPFPIFYGEGVALATDGEGLHDKFTAALYHSPHKGVPVSLMKAQTHGCTQCFPYTNHKM